MPDYFSHYIAAEKIFERLNRGERQLIDDKILYLLGAQGGDVFFAYSLKPTKTNLGRKLHVMDAELLFNELVGGNLSYAAGFATHYALDCSLHPLIYSFEEDKKNLLTHLTFEGDLGLYISRKFAVRRSILPRERVINSTFSIYDSIKRVESGVTVTGVERCLKRHFIYTRYLYKNKKQTYKFDYDYSSLSGAVDDGIELGVNAVKNVLSGHIDGAIFSKQFLQK